MTLLISFRVAMFPPSQRKVFAYSLPQQQKRLHIFINKKYIHIVITFDFFTMVHVS
jgi:hypothetical protein